jgi:hypothetical protein
MNSHAVQIVADANCGERVCVRLGTTVVPAKPDDCPVTIYSSEGEVKQPFETLCLLNARTSSGLFNNRSLEEATRRLKEAACKCGADAVIVTDLARETMSSWSWGRSGAKGIAIRYTGQPAGADQVQQPKATVEPMPNQDPQAIAIKMLREGVAPGVVSRVTGLSIEQVQQLKITAEQK